MCVCVWMNVYKWLQLQKPAICVQQPRAIDSDTWIRLLFIWNAYGMAEKNMNNLENAKLDEIKLAIPARERAKPFDGIQNMFENR